MGNKQAKQEPEETWLQMLDTPVANLRGSLLLFFSYSIGKNIRTEGAIKIAESLKVNTCLTTLNLHGRILQ